MSANNEVNANTEISEWMLDGSLLYRLQFGVNCDEINVTMTNRSRKESDRAVVAGELLKHLSIAQPVPEPVFILWQNGETGNTGVCTSQDVEWGFFEANPRLLFVQRLYTSPIPPDLLTRTIEAVEIGISAGNSVKEAAENHGVPISHSSIPADILHMQSVLADLRKIGGIK